MDQPRTLKDDSERGRRLGMLRLPHVRSLTKFVEEMNKAKVHGSIPYFDPLDGGVRAKALFLFEKPGPRAFKSGFISRNNDDPTAENTFRFMAQAKLPRSETCLWNVIPGWNGERKITASELDAGIESLQRVFGLMPNLKIIVLVGLRAQTIENRLSLPPAKILKSFHPSPINYAVSPEKWRSIPQEWAKARRFLQL